MCVCIVCYVSAEPKEISDFDVYNMKKNYHKWSWINIEVVCIAASYCTLCEFDVFNEVSYLHRACREFGVIVVNFCVRVYQWNVATMENKRTISQIVNIFHSNWNNLLIAVALNTKRKYAKCWGAFFWKMNCGQMRQKMESGDRLNKCERELIAATDKAWIAAECNRNFQGIICCRGNECVVL